MDWNTTTYSTILQNASTLFPAGYVIQSSTSFAQQTNAVTETTNVQYQLPPQVYTQIPYSLINSVSLNATQTGTSGFGSLVVSTDLPIQTLSLNFTTGANRIEANATAHIYYNAALASVFPDFANESIFQKIAMKTLQNKTWTEDIASQIENETKIPFTSDRILRVLAFNSTVIYPNSASASVNIGFVAEPYGSAADFVAAVENALSTHLPSALDMIIRSALSLVTGESLNLTYTGRTGMLIVLYTTNYVNNLDSQLNGVKNQYFQYVLGLLPSADITPCERFLNATAVTVSKISMTTGLDLHTGTLSTTLNGLLIDPPTVGSNTNFTIPGLFTTIGSTTSSSSSSSPGMNITLVGGSDSRNQVKIIVPIGTPSPSSTTSNSAIWMNVKNASELMNVRFEVQPVPVSLIGFLTSTTGLAIETIIATAIIAGIVVYARKRHSRLSSPMTPSGPTPSPGFGPSPPSPTQSHQWH
jgi:hypothetical protein